MKLVAAALGLQLLIISSLIADSPSRYSAIRIFVPDRLTLTRLGDLGLDFEGSHGKVGGSVEFVVSDDERKALDDLAIPYEISVPDLAQTYRSKLSSTPFNAMGFGYGSMGGYYTFAEVKAQLDTMRLLYPGLISSIQQIGSTNEGRAIWAAKISDNPDTDEDGEAEALFTALHHAREPAGMMTVVYYMWWLLENYTTDPEAEYLVNNRETWFIPVVNPDGYVYNQTTDPAGGGLWRKNRRNNGDGSYGIDLNRNYGTFEMWNAPNGGSSTSTGSSTYRGPSPFSEPESQAIDAFMRSHEIKTCLNYHTYSRLLVMPWGYLSQESGDSLIFREFAYDMVGDNRYASGTDQQTVNYSTRGNSDDYMYGDTSKPRTYAMTPEVGTSFWPSSAQILPLALENLSANQYFTYVAGSFPVLKSYDVLDAGSDGFLDPGEMFSLELTVRNKGLGNAHDLTIEVESVPDLLMSGSILELDTLFSRTDSSVILSGTVSSQALLGRPIVIHISLSDPDGYSATDSIVVVVGTPTILLNDDGGSGLGNWTSGWGSSSDAHTPPSSFTDSPGAAYAANANNSLQLVSPIDLTGFEYVSMDFWTKWAIEPTWDFGLVEVSTDNGSTWSSQRSGLMHKGSGFGSVQPTSSWGYDGYTPGLTWLHQSLDLSSFKDQEILVRFRLGADGGDQRDGWYIDDVRILGYRAVSQYSAITVRDAGSANGTINFGETGGATDGIDSALAETTLAPKPAAGIFDIRWKLPTADEVSLDLRDTLGTANTGNTFILEFQPGSAGYPMSISWNPGSFLPGAWYLRDANTSGSMININMWTDTAVAISDTGVKALEIVHTLTDTMTMNFSDKWNMFSLPIDEGKIPVALLLPMAVSNAFAFAGSYNSADSLEPRIGYWVKLAGDTTVSVAGKPIVRFETSIPEGWQLLGGLSYLAPASASLCTPSPCGIFVYRSGYTVPSEIEPGEAFWIKGPKTFKLTTLIGSSSSQKQGLSPESGSQRWSKLLIKDKAGSQTQLYFDDARSITEDLERYELPPIPPSGAFDARFASGRIMEIADPRNTVDFPFFISSPTYPINIEWEVQSAREFEASLVIDGTETTIRETGHISIPDDAGDLKLRLRPVAAAIPTQFGLDQNYPNPYNPATTISFDIPTASVVSLEIFNVLGQRVQSLLSDREYKAGKFALPITTAELASGLYFYVLTGIPTDGDQPVRLSKKMMLLK